MEATQSKEEAPTTFADPCMPMHESLLIDLGMDAYDFPFGKKRRAMTLGIAISRVCQLLAEGVKKSAKPAAVKPAVAQKVKKPLKAAASKLPKLKTIATNWAALQRPGGDYVRLRGDCGKRTRRGATEAVDVMLLPWKRWGSPLTFKGAKASANTLPPSCLLQLLAEGVKKPTKAADSKLLKLAKAKTTVNKPKPAAKAAKPAAKSAAEKEAVALDAQEGCCPQEGEGGLQEG
ncbi:hypothetical protein L7F22_003653 [Adiantum nelumboides]|nr:hypothetical protein [Adiantum nelumboides]